MRYAVESASYGMGYTIKFHDDRFCVDIIDKMDACSTPLRWPQVA
jgi:hypothetical protein